MFTGNYDLFRALQTISLNVGVIVCLTFLWQYRKAWDFRDKFSRFVVALNVTYVLVVLSVTLGRVALPDSAEVEFAKFVIFTLLVVVLASQIRLRSIAKSKKQKG